MKPPSTVERPADRHVTQLVKRSALAAGVRGDLTEGERRARILGAFRCAQASPPRPRSTSAMSRSSSAIQQP